MHSPVLSLAVDFPLSDPAPQPVSVADGASIRLAQQRWAQVPLAKRLALLGGLRERIASQARHLAEASARPRQRPTAEALTSEVMPLADACRFLEKNAERLLAPQRLRRKGLPLWLGRVHTEIRREPLGLVLVIGPSNYPLLLPGVQLIQSLIAGNAVLLKPGTAGTPAARALVDLVRSAGFDARLVTLFPESVQAVDGALALHPDKVLLTGSATTGERILGQLAPRLVPAVVELSGNDSVIVRADADLELATKALLFGLRLNNSQTCLAPRRVFVAPEVATELEGRLAEALRRSQQDSAQLNEAPSARDLAREQDLRAFVEEALAAGGHLIAGSLISAGRLRLPVILGGVRPGLPLLHRSWFVPVLTLVTVASDAEAVAAANDCPYALGASIFSSNQLATQRIAAQLRAGIVTINDLIVPSADPRIPFGGRGRSGFGVTRGAEGLLELTALKVVTRTHGRFRPAFEPPRLGDEQLFESYARLAHGRGLRRRGRALLALVRNLLQRTKQL